MQGCQEIYPGLTANSQTLAFESGWGGGLPAPAQTHKHISPADPSLQPPAEQRDAEGRRRLPAGPGSDSSLREALSFFLNTHCVCVHSGSLLLSPEPLFLNQTVLIATQRSAKVSAAVCISPAAHFTVLLQRVDISPPADVKSKKQPQSFHGCGQVHLDMCVFFQWKCLVVCGTGAEGEM